MLGAAAWWGLLSAALAQTTYSWDAGGANTSWGTASNWMGDGVPTFNTNALLVFDTNVGTADTLFLGAQRQIRGLNFGANLTGGADNVFDIQTRTTSGGATVANLLLNGGATNASITLDANTILSRVRLGTGNVGTVVFQTATDLFHSSPGTVLQFDGSATGAGSLNKHGVGTVTFTRTNSYNGLNLHGGGAVVWNNAAVLGTNSVTLGEAGSTRNVSLFVGSGLNYTNAITVSSGSGTRLIGNTAVTNQLPGFTAITGNPTLSGGINLAAGQNVTFAITNYSATTDRLTLGGAVTGTGGVVKTGTGILILNASNTYSGTTDIQGGKLYLAGAGRLGSGAVAIASGASLDFATGAGQTNIVANNISGSGEIFQNVANTRTVLTGEVTSTGGMTLNAGTMIIGDGATGSYTGDAVVNTGAVLAFGRSNAYIYEGTISGLGAVTKVGAGALTLTATNTYSGVTSLFDGALVAGDAAALGAGGNITFRPESGNDGTLRYTAASAGTDWASRIKNSTGTIRLDTAGNNVTLAGAIDDSNTNGLAKSGTGTLTLAGTNTYRGNTTVGAGTLALGVSGTMRFVVGQSGQSTVVAGGGNFAARGTFTLDLTGAATNAGASWQLVASAAKTFDETFAVAGFTESPAGTWSLSANGATYQFVESNGALFVVNVPPYDMWSRGYGLDPDGDGAPEADPDGDSLSNLREYAFGSNPVEADVEAWHVSRDGANLVFSWLQRTDGSVSYTLLEHADLVTGPWLPSAVAVEPATGPTPQQGYEWVRISVPADGKKFFRVQASWPQRQSITFDSLPTKTSGLPPFKLQATASSGLPVSYTSSNPAVATVAGNTVTIVGVGTTTITASQAGDNTYSAAADVRQTLTVLAPTSLTVDAKADFGAVGDGIADDTDALQNALDYLSARMVSDGGACLVLPPGTYKITRRLNFEKSTARLGQCQGVTIRGAESRGPDATIIYSTGTEGALFFNVNDDNGFFYQFGVRIQDLQIQAGAADAGAAIEIKRMSAIDNVQSVVPLIKNVAITTDTDAKYFRYGIVGRKVVWPHFTDVSITGVRSGTEACIFLERVYSFTVNNCHLAGAKTGVDARLGGEQNDIMHSTITDVNTGINMQVDPFGPTGPSSLGGAIYGCQISAWDAGVIIDHKGFFVVNDNAFVSLGNASGYRHLSIKKVHSTVVSDNTFTGAANQTGVYLENPFCRRNTIAYNDFGSLATAVQVGSGVETTMILDNLPADAPVTDAGSGTFVRRNAPRAFRDTAARYPAYGYEPGRVLVPWNQMVRGPVVKVTDYGANGLDALDDTAAIQSAVSAVQAHLDHGGQATLYFPAGLYHLASRLDLTQAGANWQNLTICGDGAHVSAIAVTGTQGVFKIDCTQPVPVRLHGLRIDPRTANPSNAIEITQQNGTVDGDRSLLMQDVHFFTWDTNNGRHFRGAIKGEGAVRPLLQNVEMRSVSTDLAGEFGIHFTGGHGFDWQGGRIYGKQAAGIIHSLGGSVNIRGPWFNVGGLSGLTLDANGGSFSWNAAHTDAPVNLRVSQANDAAVINTLTLSGPQNQDSAIGTTLFFENCTDLVVRDNILAAAFQTPRPSNVFVQLGAPPETCTGFDISGNMMIFNEGEGTGINIPAGNMNGTVHDNRFFGNSIADIVCDEPSTVISLLP